MLRKRFSDLYARLNKTGNSHERVFKLASIRSPNEPAHARKMAKLHFRPRAHLPDDL